MNQTVAKSITKTLDLSADPKAVFKFLANPLNWPQFAIVNLKSIKTGKEGEYQILSKNGPGQLKMLSHAAHGILDHVWKDSQASWNVYMRVIPNGDGATLMTTFFQPAQIDENTFSRSMEEMDLEFAKLKEILERSSITV
jgi:hypothetical protein